MLMLYDRERKPSPAHIHRYDQHDRAHAIGSIVPALAKNARTGHPQFWSGKQKFRSLGHPPNYLFAVGLP
jgi:hypothetical protein